MKNVLILPIVFTLLSTPAFALQKPVLSSLDRRVEYVTYSENEVYSIHAINGIISTIVFSPDEEVISYGSGFSTAWEFASRGNHFFLKPKGKEGTTNLVVLTNKRTYVFDVRLGWNRKKATYRLTFSYPDEILSKALKQAKEKEIQSLLNQNSHANTLMTNSVEVNRNYTMNFGKHVSSRDIAPIEAFDNGEFTYLKFNKAVDFPAVYRALEDEQESLINSHVEDDYLVIHGVYKKLHLRAGLAVVGIYNESYSGNGNTTTSGVTVPGLSRAIKGE